MPAPEELKKKLKGKTKSTTLEMPAGWTASELCSLDFPEPKWIVPGIMPEGLTILAGRPKIGKSWLCLNMGIAVATGGRVLGNMRVEQGEVLYLALEDSPRRLKKRLLSILAGGIAPAELHIKTVWPKIDQGGVALLLQWFEEHPLTRLVMIDTLQKLVPKSQKSDGDNQYGKDYDLVGTIKAVADAYNACVQVAHHLRKADAEDPLDKISGTIGLSGGADTILILDRKRGKTDATLFCTGRDIEEVKLSLCFDQAITTWISKGLAPDVDLTREQERIVEAVEAIERLGKPAKRGDIAKLVNKSPNATGKILQKLAESGIVVINDEGGYTLYNNNIIFGTYGTHGTYGTYGTHGTHSESAIGAIHDGTILAHTPGRSTGEVPKVPLVPSNAKNQDQQPESQASQGNTGWCCSKCINFTPSHTNPQTGHGTCETPYDGKFAKLPDDGQDCQHFEQITN